MQTRDKIKTTAWTRADALKVKIDDPTTTQPLVSLDFPVLDSNLFIWDTMPLRNLQGNVVSVNGWSVIFTLTATRMPEQYKAADGSYDINADWVDRHGRARMYYWYSKDSKNWILGGRVMAEGVSPTSREWAGTPVLLNNDGDVELYYTCVTPGATIAKVKGKISTSKEGVQLTSFEKVISLFSADGVYYQTEEQNQYWNFRDPSPFIDPVDVQLSMVFEGNVAGKRGEYKPTSKDRGLLPESYVDFANENLVGGCSGLAKARDSEGLDWEILPPLITAVGVNDQTERPHFVFLNGKYYLFTISHQGTYAENIKGPDGVYGFVSDSLFGPYEPLNGSGLVLGNPSSQPFQTYSHCVMPNGLVTSFIDNIPNPEGGYRVGGTEAPTVKIELEGNRTYVVKTLDYGFIPPMENVVLR